MTVKLYTAALLGLEGQIVEVEVDYRSGMFNFTIVGLADKAVQEAKERVMAAVRNVGAEFKQRKIIVNLAPADLPKSGPSYDLPIALGYLAATEQLDVSRLTKSIVIGELSLTGDVRPVAGVLAIVDAAKDQGFSTFYVPAENAAEAALVPNVQIFPVNNLRSLVAHLDSPTIAPYSAPVTLETEITAPEVDLKHIKGQAVAKRAIEIAAAGGHNALLSGVPGAGKTLLAKAMLGILPPLSHTEAIQITKIYSVAGLLQENKSLLSTRPFRAPHHTSSQVSLIGGGAFPRPGEVTLAHHGVLFMDELPEFSPHALEVLRQPLEDKHVTISRAAHTARFPAKFMLIAAMNPCRCGHAGDPERACICSQRDIARYQQRLSGPFLDRIDLLLHLRRVTHGQLQSAEIGESSQTVSKRVAMARERQLARYKQSGNFLNADLPPSLVSKYLKLDKACQDLMLDASEKLQLSARSYYKTLKVARTIADLNSSEGIGQNHLLEAISYRSTLPTG
jgi:magnesium chelatase family protein